jgi:formylmethanofuran dehydrogenase subunit E
MHARQIRQGITVHAFDLTVTDIGKLAITLVDAATVAKAHREDVLLSSLKA